MEVDGGRVTRADQHATDVLALMTAELYESFATRDVRLDG